jgi:hypothetical protein
VKTIATTFLTQVRKGLCVLCLLLLTASAAYSAAATALDHSSRFPAWESTLGWFLFILPCELLIGLVLLTIGDRAQIGFRFVVTNVLMYVGFMCLEGALAADTWNRATLEVVGGWSMFFLIAIGATHLLRRQASAYE